MAYAVCLIDVIVPEGNHHDTYVVGVEFVTHEGGAIDVLEVITKDGIHVPQSVRDIAVDRVMNYQWDLLL